LKQIEAKIAGGEHKKLKENKWCCESALGLRVVRPSMTKLEGVHGGLLGLVEGQDRGTSGEGVLGKAEGRPS